MIGRRGFLRGAGLLLAAPAIVRASSLMPVSVWSDGPWFFGTSLVPDIVRLQADMLWGVVSPESEALMGRGELRHFEGVRFVVDG